MDVIRRRPVLLRLGVPTWYVSAGSTQSIEFTHDAGGVQESGVFSDLLAVGFHGGPDIGEALELLPHGQGGVLNPRQRVVGLRNESEIVCEQCDGILVLVQLVRRGWFDEMNIKLSVELAMMLT